ncbi:MAG TPA: hypothetical protein VEF04_12230 [Blastocatellia bacterium]|nr:hypothetical protein [Blastocatellia bacterium]
MPISLKQATGERIVQVTVAVIDDMGQLKNETLNVRFKPITPAWLDKPGREDEHVEKRQLIEMLADLVTDLDIRDNGQAVPVTGELLESLDFSFLNAVFKAIREYTFPNA